MITPDRDAPALRGIKRITEFLRIEMDEPELKEGLVAAWVRAGKIDVDRFGRNVVGCPPRLRASIGKRPAA
ncbi:MAG: hypothetical protein WB611_21045 [Stellaceae bacterium]